MVEFFCEFSTGVKNSKSPYLANKIEALRPIEILPKNDENFSKNIVKN